MEIFAYTIKIVVSTFVIWLSIHIADRGNYRNTLKNAFITAVILSFAGNTPFIFLFGLIIWVYILINWYSVGFFRSFLCVIVYGVIFFLLQLFLATALVAGAFTVSKMADTRMYVKKWEEFKKGIVEMMDRLPESFQRKFKVKAEPTTDIRPKPSAKKVRIYLTNGRVIKGAILMEGIKGILVDIADGRSEVVIRKDMIDRIE